MVKSEITKRGLKSTINGATTSSHYTMHDTVLDGIANFHATRKKEKHSILHSPKNRPQNLNHPYFKR